MDVCLEEYKCRFGNHHHLGNNHEKAKKYGYTEAMRKFGVSEASA